MPMAPVPAKRSRKWAPGIFGLRTLKRVSRRRSLVGRRLGRAGDFSWRLRYWPAITRMVEILREKCGKKNLSQKAAEAQGAQTTGRRRIELWLANDVGY